MRGVFFDDKHSFDYYKMILNSKSIPLPTPKTKKIDIPGANGSLDLSTALTGGEIKYENRDIKLIFTLLSGSAERETIKSKIANELHGRVKKLVFDVDDGYYYIGRCTMSEFTDQKSTAKITISVDAEPYKYNLYSTTEDWKWDTFNFETGIIWTWLCNVMMSASDANPLTITIPIVGMSVVPTFIISDVTQLGNVIFNGISYPLQEGKNIFPSILLTEGDNIIKLSGKYTYSIDFRGGIL